MRKPKFLLLAVFLVFTIIFCLISLVNHYNFRTNAFDLGINNNAIYDYAHFRWNSCTLLLSGPLKNTLSGHFSLLPIFFSPLYWIMGTYTLLIVQVLGILFGGYGIYLYISEQTQNKKLGITALIHFFSLWGIYSALAFDYHDNVMGAVFVPWFFYFFQKKNWHGAFLFFILILITKENVALWMSFIGIGLMALYWKDKVSLRYSTIFAIASIIYFIIVIKWIIPSLADEWKGYMPYFQFSSLGNNWKEVFKTIFLHPFYTFRLLFESQVNDPDSFGIKSELHFMVLLSGGYALLYKPQYLIMLLPIYGQKMFMNDIQKWGINNHYSIEFVPILTIALFHWLFTFRQQKIFWYVVIICVLLTIGATRKSLESRLPLWYDKTPLQFYSSEYYKRKFDVAELHHTLKLIPADAKVSAHSQIVPHVAFRDYIYLFPNISDAEYIVLLENENPYPLSQEEFKRKTDELLNSPEWEIVYHGNSTIILRRKG